MEVKAFAGIDVGKAAHMCCIVDAVGKNILNYDSMLVLAHFKGHPMGGCGGALKQLSIGCASRAGKALIHSAGGSNQNLV